MSRRGARGKLRFVVSLHVLVPVGLLVLVGCTDSERILAEIEPVQTTGATTGSSSAGPDPDLIGFASEPARGLDTTIGGGDLPAEIVESGADLEQLLTDSEPHVIHIPEGEILDLHTEARPAEACAALCGGTLTPGRETYRAVAGQACTSDETPVTRTRNELKVSVASNKTLLGLGRGATLRGVWLDLGTSSNIIIRNLTFEDVNPALHETGDAITIGGGHHVWVNHCAFRRIGDGQIDVTKGSRAVTLSYDHFDGRNDADCEDRHRFISIVTDSEVTLHHNFFDFGGGKHPQLVGSETRAHLFNNYWLDITYFSVTTLDGAQALLEGNVFEDADRPHWAQTGWIQAPVGSNLYLGRSADDGQSRDSNASVFVALDYYPYELDATADVAAEVSRAAGPRAGVVGP